MGQPARAVGSTSPRPRPAVRHRALRHRRAWRDEPRADLGIAADMEAVDKVLRTTFEGRELSVRPPTRRARLPAARRRRRPIPRRRRHAGDAEQKPARQQRKRHPLVAGTGASENCRQRAAAVSTASAARRADLPRREPARRAHRARRRSSLPESIRLPSLPARTRRSRCR